MRRGLEELNQDFSSVIIFFCIVFVILGAFIILFMLLYRYRHNKMIKERQLLEAMYKQTLLQTQLEIQEQTFQNISQEIHDNIGQVLTLAKLNLNTVGTDIPEPAGEKVLRSKELVSKAISDLRDLSKSLNTDMVKELGLYEIVQRELIMVSRSGQFQANFTADGDPQRFDKQKELIIFRIFQELLHNIIKHSNAKTINVQLVYTTGQFGLTVYDDGKGFDTASLSTEQSFGLGLRNMQNRATLIGATLQLHSVPGQGTTAYIELPLPLTDAPA